MPVGNCDISVSLVGLGCFEKSGKSVVGASIFSSLKRRSSIRFSSYFLQKVRISGLSISFMDRSSMVVVSGMSVFIVVSTFERRASSAPFATFSASFPLRLFAFWRRFSTVPYVAISVWAVLGPMPGMPGMLSDASPARAR